MKNLKKLLVVAIVVGLFGAVGVAYAATAKTPVQITAELTGKTVGEVCQERATGKTCGAIANEAGQLEQFKTQMLEQKKIVLDQRVNEGRLTQEQANNIYNTIQSRQATCDGTGNTGLGRNGGGNGFNMGMGNGSSCAGSGISKGSGRCSGFGSGNGVCDGTAKGNGNGVCDGTAKGNGSGLGMKNSAGNCFGSGLNK